MGRYFFNVQVGSELQPDLQGVELPNLVGVRIEALTFASELLRDFGPGFWETEGCSLEVKDEQGLVLFSLLLHPTVAPVLSAYRP